MPVNPPKRKLPTLKPRLKEIDLLAGFGVKSISTLRKRTLKDKQRDNGRTLALDSTAWRKMRAHVLAGEPLCRHCVAMGLTVPATEVDHRDNNPANNDPINLCPLCKPCHSRKTARDMGHNVRMGCDAHGTPLDPSHPWNKAASGVLASHAPTHAERSPATDSPTPTCLL